MSFAVPDAKCAECLILVSWEECPRAFETWNSGTSAETRRLAKVPLRSRNRGLVPRTGEELDPLEIALSMGVLRLRLDTPALRLALSRASACAKAAWKVLGSISSSTCPLRTKSPFLFMLFTFRTHFRQSLRFIQGAVRFFCRRLA